ncbi:hypothetical protein ACRZIA_003880 [Klebsiella michiganensis]
MYFTVERKLQRRTLYPQLGIYADITPELLEVTYVAKEVISLNGKNALVAFDVILPSTMLISESIHEFEYSGTGNPLEEAASNLLVVFLSELNAT